MLNVADTEHGWLITDGKRWLGPGEGWKSKPAECRNFATEEAAGLQLRRMAESEASQGQGLDDTRGRKPVSRR